MIEEKTAASEAVAAAKQQQQAAQAGGKPAMRIKVYSPFKVYYDEESFSISGINATGPFDILPHHHNFMSLLEPCILTLRPANRAPAEQKIRISGGLMHVKADKVTVFLNI
jgi:F0F1-type ATP synthase epsilon subunit